MFTAMLFYSSEVCSSYKRSPPQLINPSNCIPAVEGIKPAIRRIYIYQKIEAIDNMDRQTDKYITLEHTYVNMTE